MEYEHLEAIGQWMNINSQAIYETKPLAPYQEGQWCFTQSKDGKTRYAFYLKEEGEILPETLELPAGFVKQAGEVYLLGFPGKLEIKRENKLALVDIPVFFAEESFGVLVFEIEE
jgi:alpha-L-fucosidase